MKGAVQRSKFEEFPNALVRRSQLHRARNFVTKVLQRPKKDVADTIVPISWTAFSENNFDGCITYPTLAKKEKERLNQKGQTPNKNNGDIGRQEIRVSDIGNY